MRVLTFTFRSRAIFTLPCTTTSRRCFSALGRKPKPEHKISSIIVLHRGSGSGSVLSARAFSSSSYAAVFLQRNSSFAASRCVSSISSSAARIMETDDAVGRVEAEILEEDEMTEASKACIPVRAYFFSTRSVDFFI